MAMLFLHAVHSDLGQKGKRHGCLGSMDHHVALALMPQSLAQELGAELGKQWHVARSHVLLYLSSGMKWVRSNRSESLPVKIIRAPRVYIRALISRRPPFCARV